MNILPEPYQRLIHAFNHGDWSNALKIATTLMTKVGDDPAIHYIAGVSSSELNRIPSAITYLTQAATLAPERADYATQLAKVLAFAKLNRDAKVSADRAYSLAPKDPRTLDTLGVVYSQIGDYGSAVAAFQEVVRLAPDYAPYRYNLATSLVADGKLAEAEEEIDACLSLDPRFWRAHLTLAQLKRQTRESNHVERLTSLLKSTPREPPDLSAQVCLNLALFKEYEDIGEYQKALEYLTAGKSAGRVRRGYSPEAETRLFEAIMENFPVPLPRDTGGLGTTEPIFVVGMPRTGTTLVERIISNHPEVQSAGELLNFPLAVKHASGTTTPNLIDLDTVLRARNPAWSKLGEDYLSSTRPLTGSKRHFVDKLPHNFLYLGWIANALPEAKIVCLRRNPMDTCLSNFRQLFAPKAPYFDYSYDLLDTGRYYLLFHRLMAHWRMTLQDRLFEVNYEDLIDEQERTTRELVDFCGLSWDDRCLQFESNPTPVATASAVQVRSPIYRSSMSRWKKYGQALDDLRQLIESSGVTVE